jgi:hypothetical protein
MAAETDLSRISTREIVKRYRQLKAAAHNRAFENLLERIENEQVSPVSGESQRSELLEEARLLELEVKRRLQAGDPGLLAIGADNLKRDFGRVSARSFANSVLNLESTAEGQKPLSEKTSGSSTSTKWYESSIDVLKRRQIVLKNPKVPAQALCKAFDSQRIPLPPGWEDKYRVTTWVEAYKAEKARPAIQRIISTDKRQA